MQSVTFKLGRSWNTTLRYVGFTGLLLVGLMVLLGREIGVLDDPVELLTASLWLAGAVLALTALRWLARGTISVGTDRISKQQFWRRHDLGWNEINVVVIRRHRQSAPTPGHDAGQGVETARRAAAAAARTDDWIIMLASEDGRQLTIDGADIYDSHAARLTLIHILRDRLHDGMIFDRIGFMPAPWRDRDEPTAADRTEGAA